MRRSTKRKPKSRARTWRERIATAKRRGYFNEADRLLASGWTTCACGQQDKLIPRGLYGMPLDLRLANLGRTFHHRVESNRFDAARETLEDIERRAVEVLQARFKIGGSDYCE